MESSTLQTKSSLSNVQTLGWILDNRAGVVEAPSSSAAKRVRDAVLLFTFGSTNASDTAGSVS